MLFLTLRSSFDTKKSHSGTSLFHKTLSKAPQGDFSTQTTRSGTDKTATFHDSLVANQTSPRRDTVVNIGIVVFRSELWAFGVHWKATRRQKKGMTVFGTEQHVIEARFSMFIGMSEGMCQKEMNLS